MEKERQEREDLPAIAPEAPMQIAVDEPAVDAAKEVPTLQTAAKKAVAVEVTELRGEDRSVFMTASDACREVIYAQPVRFKNSETDTFTEQENAGFVPEKNGMYYCADRGSFRARFSKSEEDNELFSVEKDQHKLSFALKRRGRTRAGKRSPRMEAAKKLVFENASENASLEYAVHSNRVKENIIISEPAAEYRYTFLMRMENLRMEHSEQERSLRFLSTETDEEIFNIPAPYMEDAAGEISHAVFYEVKERGEGELVLTVIADGEWIGADERAFPVTVDPQVNISGLNNMYTYSWVNGYMSAGSSHFVGIGRGGCDKGRMYIRMTAPQTLRRHTEIKKAELTVFQKSGTIASATAPKLGLYHVENGMVYGNCTPINSSLLTDYAVLKAGSAAADGSMIQYTFDVTELFDQSLSNSRYYDYVLKLTDESGNADDEIYLYGANSNHAPQLAVTYESGFGVTPADTTHTIGFFGTAGLQLRSGKLQMQFTDFAWNGNRMPVSISHLYSSALAGYAYTANTSIGLHTADFSAMKIGEGWKLSCMQSIVASTFLYTDHNAQTSTVCNGYIYMDENGVEHYLRESAEDEHKVTNADGSVYYLYADTDNASLTYDAVKRQLSQFGSTYWFDTAGRLTKITDEAGNTNIFTYVSGILTSITDGVGREFTLNYNSAGNLISISAPDGSQMTYAYTNNMLTTVTYPDRKRAVLTYVAGKPTSVLLQDKAGTNLYEMKYDYVGDRCTSVQEFGKGQAGVRTTYNYSILSRRTMAVSMIPAGDGEPEQCVNTIYTFDDDGNMVSKYAYTEETGNSGVAEGGSGIHPFGENGMSISGNAANLLLNHSFDTLDHWYPEANNCASTNLRAYAYQAYALYGTTVLRMQTQDNRSVEKGVYQTVTGLTAGDYTFSVYVRPVTDAVGAVSNPGVYLQVKDQNGQILGQSERLTKSGQGFVRLSVPFTLAEDGNVKVRILMDGNFTLYADGAQLEKNACAGPYNLLTNGNFERNAAIGWNTSDSSIIRSNNVCFNGTSSLRFAGDLDSIRYAYQRVPVKSAAGTRESFTLSGWAKGYAIHDREREGAPAATFRLKARIRYADETTEDYTADFCPCTEDWQLASVQFAKSEFKEVLSLDVSCEYDHNVGIAYFDDIQLIRNSLETGLSSSDFKDESDGYGSFDEEIAELEEETEAFAEVTDQWGNALTETTFTDHEVGTVYRSFAYNADDPGTDEDDGGNDRISETDARGNTTYYTVDPETSRTTAVTDRCGNVTEYAYTPSGNIASLTKKNTFGTVQSYVNYDYDIMGQMTKISRGDGMGYSMSYTNFHQLQSIGVTQKDTLVTYRYKEGNGRLRDIYYGNGDRVSVKYTAQGQIASETWYDSYNKQIARYKYVYNNEGNLTSSIDILGEKIYNYTYESGVLKRCTESDITIDANEIIHSKDVIHTTLYFYDEKGRLLRKTITDKAGNEFTYRYTELENQSLTSSFTAGGNTVQSHSKADGFGRMIFDELRLGTGFLNRQFTYHDGVISQTHEENNKKVSSPTTNLVKEIVYSDGRTIAYEYDPEERISKVTDSVDGVTEYTYDVLGQLTSETVNGVKTTYVYDKYGNLLHKGVCNEDGDVPVSDRIYYSYGDPCWNDLLTAYNGQSIRYDRGGNPVTYLGHTLTWEKGRQLKTFDDSTYTYNASGIRTSKTVDGVQHTYTLDGGNIVRESWGDNTLMPLYDNASTVCGILYNGTPYYFVKNLQGDVLSITDANGNTVARYRYDAWGKCTIVSDTSTDGIAAVNPYRYRTYYFDSETGLYYLQSRYYDPETGRFINADKADSFVLYSILENNLFAYCLNDPINNKDENGRLAGWIVKKIVQVILGAFIGIVQQFLADIFLSAFRRKFELSSFGTYVSSAVSGGWDALWGGGLAVEICKSLLSNIIGQMVDMWNGAKFDFEGLLLSIADGLFSYVLNKVFKTPKFIRDIKKEAIAKGIKGTKKLMKFLNKRIAQMEIIKFTFGAIKTAVSSLVSDCLDYAKQCAREFYNDLCNLISPKYAPNC